MKNIQVIASAIPTMVLATEAGRRLTGNGGMDIRLLSNDSRQAFLAAQSAYANAIREAQEEIVTNEIKSLVSELGLVGAPA